MTKRTITITWLVGIGVMIVGGLVVLFTGLAIASHIGAATNNFQSGVTYVPDSPFWGLVSVILLGIVAIIAGFITQFVAWIGAVINTNRLADKTWFNIMLWVGIAAIVLNLLSGLGTLLGWGLMIVYLIGGPDGTTMEPMMLRTAPYEPPRPAPVEPPRPLAPTG
jgi:hypothetical protein